MRACLVLVAVVFGALFGATARAQDREPFSTVRYRPALGPGSYIGLESASGLAPRRVVGGLGLSYARDALVLRDPCRALPGALRCVQPEVALLTHTTLLHVGIALGLGRATQLALDLPIGRSRVGALPYTIGASDALAFREVRPRDGFVVGDLRALAKTRLYARADRRLQVAAALSVTLPSGRITSARECRSAGSCSYVAEQGTQLGALAIVEGTPAPGLRVVANVGLLYRRPRTLLGTEVGSEVSLAAGAAYALVGALGAKAELASSVMLRGAADTPVEARAGLTYGRDLVATLGAGAGIVRDVGSPRYRLLISLAWMPVKRDEDGDGRPDRHDDCPGVPEDRDGFEDEDGCPDLDDDGDGVPDARDACRLEAEDRDGARDDDGCPDPDDDGDGVPDGYDSCEGEREDLDGDRDDDGCPDLDADRDGVLDATDRCPSEAEDADGLGDDDGCPEEDHDGDGLPDVTDPCPEQPGSATPRGPGAEERCDV